MIARACCICGTAEARPLLVDNGVPIGRCCECGFIYCVRIPDERALEAHYAEAYADAVDWLQRMSRGRQWIFPAGLAMLKQLGARGKLLDVGCSVGLFLQAARKAGFEVAGVELSPAPARFAREHFRLDVHCGTLESAPWGDGAFDVVTLWDVLEHVPDPRATMQQVARVLRPGGSLAIRVPDGEFHLWKTRLLRPWFGNRLVWMEVPNHLNHFRPRTLRRLLAETGFDVLRVRPGPPHFWGRPIDHVKTLYYRCACAAQNARGWQLGNIFEVYARRRS